MTHRDLSDEQLATLAECYADSFMPLDDLHYTQQFEELYERFSEKICFVLNKHYVWVALCNLRKTKKLVRKKR